MVNPPDQTRNAVDDAAVKEQYGKAAKLFAIFILVLLCAGPVGIGSVGDSPVTATVALLITLVSAVIVYLSFRRMRDLRRGNIYRATRPVSGTGLAILVGGLAGVVVLGVGFALLLAAIVETMSGDYLTVRGIAALAVITPGTLAMIKWYQGYRTLLGIDATGIHIPGAVCPWTSVGGIELQAGPAAEQLRFVVRLRSGAPVPDGSLPEPLPGDPQQTRTYTTIPMNRFDFDRMAGIVRQWGPADVMISGGPQQI